MIIARSATNIQRSRSFSMCIGKVLALTLAMTCAASAQTTIYVDNDNCPTPGAGSLVDPYCSIQDAIDASVDTDTIEVAPGTYHEAIDFIGKAITLLSTDGPATTIIDAATVPAVNESVSVVRCVSSEGVATVLDGFTITGGSGDTTDFSSPVGGGMYNFGSSPTVNNCIFTENHVIEASGGGMLNNDASPNVANCTFSNNSALQSAGGMYNYLASNPTVTNCKFIGNSARWGGGMFNGGGNPSLTNCLFSGNIASDFGGGIYNYESFSSILTNCTFNANSAGDSGGGIYNDAASTPSLQNCILWNDTPDEISNNNSTPTIAFSDIDGSGGSSTWDALLGTDSGYNIDADPLFIDPLGVDGLAGTIDDDLHLDLNSLAINAGNNSAVPAGVSTDLDDLPRTACNVDLGAYENQSAPLTVQNISTGSLYCTIQECIDGAVDTQECVVGPGIYSVAIDFLGKAITLRSSDGAATTIIDATRVPAAGETVPVVRCVNGETAATVLDGFTITGGTGDASVIGFPLGGGMLNNGSSPTVTNCTFIENTNGGMFNHAASPTVTHCVFIQNVSRGMENRMSSNPTVTDCIFKENFGSGMGNDKTSNPEVTNCSFIRNMNMVGFGGGMYNESSPTITNCQFIGNDGCTGGGIYNQAGANPNITNCHFIGNMGCDGGGMFNDINSNPTITGCTFIGNSATGAGGGIFSYGEAHITNCTFSENNAQRGGGIYDDSFGSVVENCTFAANTATEGGGILTRSPFPIITDCSFSGNQGTSRGGGMYNSGRSPTVTRCTFDGNEASAGGGMYNKFSSSPILNNCIFNGNIAAVDGGGMYNNDLSSPTLLNCTFSGNIASSGNGGGVVNFDQSFPTFTNCVLWGDMPDEIYNDIGNPTFSYCNIEASGGSSAWDIMLGTDGGGNIDVDPLFIDPLGPDGLTGTTDDDLRLSAGSPCIDAADYDAYINTGGGLTDLDGKDRIIDDTSVVDTGIGIVTYLDMGAYETGLCHADGIFGFDEFSNLNECLTGPASSLNLGCACVDLDFDEQIDLRDFAQFQLAFNP